MMLQNVMTLSSLMLLVAGSPAMGCEGWNSENMVAQAQNAAFKGTLVFLRCDPTDTDATWAECTTYGHRHALKSSDGSYVNLSDNRNSADLIKGEKYLGKTVKVNGAYSTDSNQVDI